MGNALLFDAIQPLIRSLRHLVWYLLWDAAFLNTITFQGVERGEGVGVWVGGEELFSLCGS